VQESNGNYCDVGGAYFGRQQTKVVQLAEELGLGFYNMATPGKSTLLYQVLLAGGLSTVLSSHMVYVYFGALNTLNIVHIVSYLVVSIHLL